MQVAFDGRTEYIVPRFQHQVNFLFASPGHLALTPLLNVNTCLLPAAFLERRIRKCAAKLESCGSDHIESTAHLWPDFKIVGPRPSDREVNMH